MSAVNRQVNPAKWVIGLVGYGEVGRILAEDLRKQDVCILAYDIKQKSADSRGALMAHAEQHGVVLAESPECLASRSDLVISAVTASRTLAAAESVAAAIKKDAFFLDFNSASPATKQVAASLMDKAGGCYVEGAVMTSVPPYRIRVPLLLGGSHAQALAPHLNVLGFSAKVGSESLGVVSATKMCRSVMIKGLESMVIESFTAARHHGVEEAVLASLQETFPGIDWEKVGTYFFQRVIEHGRRRSEEMFESANTVREAGMPAFSAQGTAERQAWMADLTDLAVFGRRGGEGFARSADWRVEADRLLTYLHASGKRRMGD